MRLFWPAKTSLLAGMAVLCCAGLRAQALDPTDGPVSAQMKVEGGPVPVVLKFHLPNRTAGLAQDAVGTDAVTLAPGLSFYQANYNAFDSSPLPFNIVGADPSLGASTTSIPTVIVPLKFVFAGSGSPTFDGTNVVAAIENSPIFQNANYAAGSVDLGTTQYGDAVQRGQFWNVAGFSQDYHVLLGLPSVAPTVTIVVPARQGIVVRLSGGGVAGVLDLTYFDDLLSPLIGSYTANQLPIFLTDNVYLSENLPSCCIAGFHDSQGPPAATAKTWIYAAYAEPGTFLGSDLGFSFSDTVPLSHEVAEWLNDPFVGGSSVVFGFLNLVPPATFGGSCLINFETGDPLEGGPYIFTKSTNSTTYHLQDEVFLPWYLHNTPSFSVNGWYTFQNLSAQVPLMINAPAAIAGSYSNTATQVWAPVNVPVTANVVYVGRGCPAGSVDGSNPDDVYLADPAGKIALIDRGSCAVSLKVDRAARAGAAGVLIGLIAPGGPVQFAYGGGTNFVPSLAITQALSNAVKSTLVSTPAVNATISPANAIPTPPSQLCGPG